MENEQKPNLETAIFHYWTRPQRPLQTLLGDDSRSPQYLKTDLVESIINLIFPKYNKRELIITPPLNEIEGGNVKTLDVRYVGNNDSYLRRIYVELIDDKRLKPWREYKVHATGTYTTIEEAITTLTEAVRGGILKHKGWIVQKPPININRISSRPNRKGYWPTDRTRPVDRIRPTINKIKPAY